MNHLSTLQVIFENEFFVVVDKPSGTLSVPSRLGEHEKRPILKNLLESQLKIKLWATHRLDFEVSGLILFAKTADAHRTANSWFEKQQIHKTYHAITEGDATKATEFSQPTEWRCYLVRGKKRAFAAPYGQESITIARFLKSDSQGLHWEMQPRTGRSHQLRFELSQHGFPIIGDTLYGARPQADLDDIESKSILLRAVKIDFSNCPDRKKFGLPDKIELS